MKRSILLISFILSTILLFSFNKSENWLYLLDENLSQWENYLSYQYPADYNGIIPKNSDGKPLDPIGYNKDKTGVFSIVKDKNEPVLRISGEIYGCIFTKKSFKNYHLSLKVKWGELTFDPRKNKMRDSGILYHSIGEAGYEYWHSWMLSQEFQVEEGHMGDFWCQANGAVDIRSYPSENNMINSVADHSQPFRTFKRGNDVFCLRSENNESPIGEWTTLELICYEGKSLHIVNGKVVMILQNSSYIDESKKAIPMIEGKIQLQSEGAEVFYKDIKIREISNLPKKYEELF